MNCCSIQTRFCITSFLIYGFGLFWLIKSINSTIEDKNDTKSTNFLILTSFSLLSSALVLFNFFDTKPVINPISKERTVYFEIFIYSVTGAFLTGFAIGIFTTYTVIGIFLIYFIGIILLLLPCKKKKKRSFNRFRNESSNSLVSV